MLSDIILQDNSGYFQIGTNCFVDNFSELKQGDYLKKPHVNYYRRPIKFHSVIKIILKISPGIL